MAAYHVTRAVELVRPGPEEGPAEDDAAALERIARRASCC
jgi:hypothetical protein